MTSEDDDERPEFTRSCNICGRKIPKTEWPALCQWCEGTARAHARVEQNRMDFEEELKHDPELRHE